jgi:hypothetical protein
MNSATMKDAVLFTKQCSHKNQVGSVFVFFFCYQILLYLYFKQNTDTSTSTNTLPPVQEQQRQLDIYLESLQQVRIFVFI